MLSVEHQMFNHYKAHSRGCTSKTNTHRLRFHRAASNLSTAMNFDYDIVIIGGAFSGAATALMLKRERPEARVVIIEKTTAFDRKV
ncbi:MAG TPA: hypothetical protein VJR28_05870, partial [Chthoniobacterales bacterium]|nr:hypothetical protein [Chthoniobacterales bacterium]